MAALNDKVLYKGIKCTVVSIHPNGVIECLSEDGLLRVLSEPSEFQTELTPFTPAIDHTPSPPDHANEHAHEHGQAQETVSIDTPTPESMEAPALPTPTPEAPATGVSDGLVQ